MEHLQPLVLGVDVTAQASLVSGREAIKEFGHLYSKSALSRLSDAARRNRESEQTKLERLFCADITIPENAVTVSASLDGIMIPLNKEAANVYQAPELVDHPSEQREARLSGKKAKAFYRKQAGAAINFYDEEGERLKTIRFGRMPEGAKKRSKRASQSITRSVLNNPNSSSLK